MPVVVVGDAVRRHSEDFALTIMIVAVVATRLLAVALWQRGRTG